MRPYTPQQLADFFQLYFVREQGIWYGCTTCPRWGVSWELDSVQIEIILTSRAVLYIGEDIDSLKCPMR